MDYAIVKDTSPQSEYDKSEYHYGYNIPYQHDPAMFNRLAGHIYRTVVRLTFSQDSWGSSWTGRLVRLQYWVRVTLRGREKRPRAVLLMYRSRLQRQNGLPCSSIIIMSGASSLPEHPSFLILRFPAVPACLPSYAYWALACPGDGLPERLRRVFFCP
jgi:hypothetical protein